VTTTTTSDLEGRRPLRLLPRPQAEPPYDDEAPATGLEENVRSPVQGTLALSFRVGKDVPAIPEPPAQLRLLPDLAVAANATAENAEEAREIEAFCARTTTPRAQLPDPRRWSARLAQGLVEVLAGIRPLAQLAPWVTDDVFADVQPRVQAAARRTNRPAGRTRAQLRMIRLCEPADGVAEVSAVVQYGNRCRALALRLEGLDGRWRCTALQFG
jgi:Family of unknown function (DUF6459)